MFTYILNMRKLMTIIAMGCMFSAVSVGAQTKPTVHKTDTTKAVKTMKSVKPVNSTMKHHVKVDSTKVKH
jgi:hypothetical protein